MDPHDWPEVPAALIDHLDKIIPERSPRRGETMEEMNFRGGQRDVVLTLRAVFLLQNETVLNVPQAKSDSR